MSSKSTGKFRTTWILLGAMFTALGVLAIYVFFGDEKKPNPHGNLLDTFQALKINANEVTGLEIEKGGEKIVFDRQADGRWRMTQPIEVRADSDRVHAIVQEMLDARRIEKGADIRPDLAVHGLDKPAVKLTLRKGDRSAWLALGKTTIGGDEAVVYVLTSDEPKQPQATRLIRLKSLFKDKPPEGGGTAGMVREMDDFRSRKLLGEGLALEAAPVQIKNITLTERLPKGEQVVRLSRDNKEKQWRFEAPAGYGDVQLDVPPEKRNPNTIYNLPSLLNNVLSMEVPAVKDFLPNARDLAALGLDPSSEGVLRIDIERDDPIGKETLWISKANAKSELDKVYVRYGGDVSVAQVNAEKARMLQKFVEDPAALRDTTLVKLPRDRVDALDITIDKKTFELRKVQGRWKVAQGDKTYDCDAGEIDRLLQRITQSGEVRGYPSIKATDAELGFDPPRVEIKIWEDSLLAAKADDKKLPKPGEAPNVRLLFGKKDLGDIVFVRRLIGANKADYKMPASLLTLASRGMLDYVNIALSPYDPKNVEKITFLRDGVIWEIERDKTNALADAAVWTVLAPPDKKGKLGNAQQIQRILVTFSDAKTGRVVSDNATAEQLATMGLDPAKPVFKIALKLRDQSAERVYYMGNEVTGTSDAYAKTNSSDFVFEWPKAKMEMVTKDRILDPVIYRVEAGNVKGMKLRGWVDPLKPGEPQVLDLERRADGNWSAKGNVKLDNRKVEEFLLNVSRPIALAVEKGVPKPDQKLDVKDGALEIEIDASGAKPITLTLGGLANKEAKQIYATSNQLPGEVFTLDGERLLLVKEKLSTLVGMSPEQKK